MSQIYNDNTKRPKPKENQLGILGISSREFTHCVGPRKLPPRKLPQLSPKSCHNCTKWFRERCNWSIAVTQLMLVSRLHANTSSPNKYRRKRPNWQAHLELCHRNPDILERMLNRIALSNSTAGKCAPMQVIKQPEHGRTSTTEEQK